MRAEQPATVNPEDEGFIELDFMHAITGFVYGNLPGLTCRRVIASAGTLGMGTEVDRHTRHGHGNTVTAAGIRTDLVNLLPASMMVTDLQPDAAGKWLFPPPLADHITAGMQALYEVQ